MSHGRLAPLIIAPYQPVRAPGAQVIGTNKAVIVSHSRRSIILMMNTWANADDTTAGLEARISLLEARLAIVTLKASYCRFIDSKSWGELAHLFTDDAALAVRGQEHLGRDSVLEYITSRLGAGIVSVHHVHSPEISITSAGAEGVWAMYDRIERPDGSGLEGAGHYVERYANEGSGWRIRRMEVTRLRLHEWTAQPL